MMDKDAVISDCSRYRYSLTRTWNPRLHRVCFIMLNPSTADANVDDQTIRKCVGFASRWSAGSIEVVNLFAFRATDPKVLKQQGADAVGPDNDRYIYNANEAADMTVAAWGVHGTFRDRDNTIVTDLALLPLAKPLYCLRTSKDGIPCHPLMLPYSCKPQRLDLSQYHLKQE